MKILVTAKRVIDPYVRVRVADDGSGVITKNAKMAMNPFDEIALEEAIRLKEAGKAEEIILLSIGTDAVQEILRKGLAMGADRAIHVDTEKSLAPLNIAKVIQHVVHQEQPQLVLMGKQTIDGDNNQTGQMLAALLDWPQATFISAVEIKDDKAICTREIDGGLESLALSLPAVLTTDLRLNEPRYASLPSIMKAKAKPLAKIAFSDLGLEDKQHLRIKSVDAPSERQAGIKLADVASLVEKLKNEAKVI